MYIHLGKRGHEDGAVEHAANHEGGQQGDHLVVVAGEWVVRQEALVLLRRVRVRCVACTGAVAAGKAVEALTCAGDTESTVGAVARSLTWRRRES